MTRHPFGRWNRDQGHRGEIVYDGRHCWFECSCGVQGDPKATTAEADAQADAHERDVFERERAGQRFVRGRFE